VLAPGAGVLADGTPGEVFARYGDQLSAEGVWVPGHPVARHAASVPPGPVLLRADRVGFRHRGAADPTLSDVDVSVSAGEAVAVLGPNGCGKSTLALLLGGLLPPSSGRVAATPELAEAHSNRPPHRWPAPVLAARIGSVFQNPEHQFVTSRVDEELALGPRRTGASPASVKSTVDDLLSRLRLDALAAANPYTLSGGEARRLSVATALATAPRLLILDEPTFGQDRRTWAELVDLLAKLRDDGCGVLAVTHDADFVTALADRRLALTEEGLL
jgi:energy-coupling factor transport system ATP-binding protein